MEYFGNGDHWGVEIQYLVEEQPLGTAGALGLFSQFPEHEILVINGDVLSRIDHVKLLQFHKVNKSSATICVREHQTKIPFGVVKVRGGSIESLEEKPLLTHNINAGIYVLESDVLKYLKDEEYKDMPEFFTMLAKAGKKIIVYPIYETWYDFGQKDNSLKKL